MTETRKLPPKREDFKNWKKYAKALEKYVEYQKKREWGLLLEIDRITQNVGEFASKTMPHLSEIIIERDKYREGWEVAGAYWPWEDEVKTEQIRTQTPDVV